MSLIFINFQVDADQMNGPVIMETALMKIGCVILEKIAEMEVMKNKIVSTTLINETLLFNF